MRLTPVPLYKDPPLLSCTAYSENEIERIANVADFDKAIGKRDFAIILLAYCTGLRGVDIIGIKLTDIDWHNNKISVIQSKTHMPIVSELNGSTMNALADYILDWRPDCDAQEIFVTVKAPYRGLSKGFGKMIDKYRRAHMPSQRLVQVAHPGPDLRGFYRLYHNYNKDVSDVSLCDTIRYAPNVYIF